MTENEHGFAFVRLKLQLTLTDKNPSEVAHLRMSF